MFEIKWSCFLFSLNEIFSLISFVLYHFRHQHSSSSLMPSFGFLNFMVSNLRFVLLGWYSLLRYSPGSR